MDRGVQKRCYTISYMYIGLLFSTILFRQGGQSGRGADATEEKLTNNFSQICNKVAFILIKIRFVYC